MVHMCTIVPAE